MGYLPDTCLNSTITIPFDPSPLKLPDICLKSTNTILFDPYHWPSLNTICLFMYCAFYWPENASNDG